MVPVLIPSRNYRLPYHKYRLPKTNVSGYTPYGLRQDPGYQARFYKGLYSCRNFCGTVSLTSGVTILTKSSSFQSVGFK